jgi:hypothetical protein
MRSSTVKTIRQVHVTCEATMVCGGCGDEFPITFRQNIFNLEAAMRYIKQTGPVICGGCIWAANTDV